MPRRREPRLLRPANRPLSPKNLISVARQDERPATGASGKPTVQRQTSPTDLFGEGLDCSIASNSADQVNTGREPPRQGSIETISGEVDEP